MTEAGQVSANHSARRPLDELARSFGRHLRAANLSPLTVKSYLEAVEQLRRFLAKRGEAPDIAAIGRAELEEFFADQAARSRPATAGNRFRSLQQFFALASRRRRDRSQSDEPAQARQGARRATGGAR